MKKNILESINLSSHPISKNLQRQAAHQIINSNITSKIFNISYEGLSQTNDKVFKICISVRLKKGEGNKSLPNVMEYY